VRSSLPWILAGVIGALACPSPAAADDLAAAPAKRPFSLADYYRATTLDFDVQLGGGYFFGGPGRGVGFVRARAGVLFASWPIFFSLGTTYELNNLSAATYGLQAEVMFIDSGFWAQAGPMVDGHGQFGGMLSVGWSLFGVEAQYRGYDDVLFDRGTHDGYGFALLGKVRIPIGFLLYAHGRR
jgi:hypothetical protein